MRRRVLVLLSMIVALALIAAPAVIATRAILQGETELALRVFASVLAIPVGLFVVGVICSIGRRPRDRHRDPPAGR